MMDKPASIPWSEVRQQLIDEVPELATEVEALAPEHEIVRQLIKVRIDCGMTQRELAARIGKSL